MKVLGIANNMHISSAALIDDGKVVAAAPEERFTRIKHTREFPINAIKYCLETANISIEEVDHISISADPGISLSKYDSKFSKVARWYPESIYSVPNNLSRLVSSEYIGSTYQTFPYKAGELKISYLNHHLCHAANGFYLSPFDKASILIVDGRGERNTAMLGYGEKNKIIEQSVIEYPNSIGLFYGTITQFLGYTPDYDEWKVMGMCAYGDENSEYYYKLRELVVLQEDGKFELDLSYFSYYLSDSQHMYTDKLVDLLGEPCSESVSFEKKHYDIAAAAQRITEEILIHLLNHLYDMTNIDKLVVSGGVFMNSLFNGKILEQTQFTDFFISSCPDDSGTSIGAALYSCYMENQELTRYIQRENYYGPEFSNKEIQSVLEKYKLTYEYVEDISLVAAHKIADGRIVGWFQGRMEFGQRALGNRSILADPRSIDIKDKLNSAVKFREEFRPFAPSVLDSCFSEYFSYDFADHTLFMSLSLPIKDKKREKVSGAIHVDGTSRVQVVSKNINSMYYDLISEFKRITGIGMIINTSFNVKGEPIVCNPSDAIRSFYSSGLDVLIMGNYLIEKRM